MPFDYEVLVIGGSHAGLSAAMALARLRRTALVCDTGEARNKVSEHANNLPSQDGMNPNLWRQKAREDLAKYPTLSFHQGAVVRVTADGSSFVAQLASGRHLRVRKVILAYGVRDQLPNLPGFRELWGHAVFHCPFCHGYEFSGRRLGLVGAGKMLEHMLPMLLGLSEDVMVFSNGANDLSSAFTDALRKRNIPLIEEPIQKLIHSKQELQAVQLASRKIDRDGLLVAPTGPMAFASDIGDQLGCQRSEFGFFSIVDMARTTVPGVFAGGDIVSGAHSVANAMASGQMAGARAAAELLHEDFMS